MMDCAKRSACIQLGLALLILGGMCSSAVSADKTNTIPITALVEVNTYGDTGLESKLTRLVLKDETFLKVCKEAYKRQCEENGGNNCNDKDCDTEKLSTSNVTIRLFVDIEALSMKSCCVDKQGQQTRDVCLPTLENVSVTFLWEGLKGKVPAGEKSPHPRSIGFPANEGLAVKLASIKDISSVSGSLRGSYIVGIPWWEPSSDQPDTKDVRLAGAVPRAAFTESWFGSVGKQPALTNVAKPSVQGKGGCGNSPLKLRQQVEYIACALFGNNELKEHIKGTKADWTAMTNLEWRNFLAPIVDSYECFETDSDSVWAQIRRRIGLLTIEGQFDKSLPDLVKECPGQIVLKTMQVEETKLGQLRSLLSMDSKSELQFTLLKVGDAQFKPRDLTVSPDKQGLELPQDLQKGDYQLRGLYKKENICSSFTLLFSHAGAR